VPAAVIFDLTIGRSDRWADAAIGYTACTAATTTVAEGCVGVGIGATVGKMLGPTAAVKSGVGAWSETLADGTVVGALAVCNAFGDVWRDGGGIIAGARNLEQGSFADATRLLRMAEVQQAFAGFSANNTTLAVVATNASLTKAMATKLAQMAQDALARTIRPVHTPLDGDTVFALSTGQRPAPHLAVLGTVAADVLAQAIERCVTEATGMGGLPAASDLSCHC
jgi:L-aminopeptidase/D-esterase-like protein